eukprot:5388484-Pyramimonas_sp.AAC.1
MIIRNRVKQLFETSLPFPPAQTYSAADPMPKTVKWAETPVKDPWFTPIGAALLRRSAMAENVQEALPQQHLAETAASEAGSDLPTIPADSLDAEILAAPEIISSDDEPLVQQAATGASAASPTPMAASLAGGSAAGARTPTGSAAPSSP